MNDSYIHVDSMTSEWSKLTAVLYELSQNMYAAINRHEYILANEILDERILILQKLESLCKKRPVPSDVSMLAKQLLAFESMMMPRLEQERSDVQKKIVDLMAGMKATSQYKKY